MSKKTGIWIDYREAFIIDPEQKQGEAVTRIASGIEDFHVRGGSRSRQPWGPMDKTNEQRYLERFKHQSRDFFKRIEEAIREAESIYVFGPAEAKKGFEKMLRADKSFNAQLFEVETADRMTHNQMVARVRDFFAKIQSD